MNPGKTLYILFTIVIWGIVFYYLHLWKVVDTYWGNALISFILVVIIFYSRNRSWTS